ncbi:T9SS type A sorting domain-containing protein [Hymenobacter sp. BT175]|nr:T9SS type A sorting domain-containing protein [Hymenobacter translucens]
MTCYNVAGQTLASRPAAESVLALSVAPNPTEGSATLSFELKQAGVVSVRVLDVTGREVAVVRQEQRLGAGAQRLELPATLKAGLYLASVTADGSTRAVRFAVVK